MGRVVAINGRPVRSDGAAVRPVTRQLPITGAIRPTTAMLPVTEVMQEPPNVEGLFGTYQPDGVRWLRSKKRALLADEMGTGKSVQALRALPKGRPAIVACPASLLYMWRDECLRFRPDLRPLVCKPGRFAIPKPGELVIVSVDSLPPPSPPNSKRWLLPEQALFSTSLIIDECHGSKNYKTQRARRVGLLAKQAATVWGLTGTPLLGHPLDLWGVLSVLGLSWEAFGDWQCFLRLFGGKKNRWGGLEFEVDPETASLDLEIQACLAKVMLRRLRKDVLPDLPDKTFINIPVAISDELRAELDRIAEDAAEAAGEDPDFDGLPAFTEMSEVRAQLARDRIPDLLEHIERFEEEKLPLIVFSCHTEPILALAGREGWGLITGDTDIKIRKTLVDAFQTGLLNGIAMTVQAGGVGLTLTRAADVFFVDQDWTPGINSQAEDRAVRIGQKAKKVRIHRMVADHPLEKRVLEVLDRKRKLIARTVG